MPRLRRKWQPNPAQRTIIDNDARFRVVAAGRRFGKTEMCRHLAFEYAWENPGTQVWWVAPTFTDSNDLGFDPMVRMIPEAALASEPRRSIPRSIDLVNGSTISFRAGTREDSLRGRGLDFLVIDEAASVPSRAWRNELRPSLSDTLGEMMAIGTPKGLAGWFHEWFERGQDDEESEIVSWQFTTYDNPLIEEAEIEQARRDLPRFAFEQEYLAKFTRPAGLVYQRFAEEDLLVDEMPENPGRVLYGVDWGFNSPAAIICIIETRTDEWFVVDEFYARRQTANDLALAAQAMQDEHGPGTFFCDPAEPDSIEEFGRHGLDAAPADNDITPGIQTVTAMLPDVRFHERCENLIREMGNYRYPDEEDDDDPDEKPIQKNDHAVDALRYALHTGARREANIGVVSGDLW